MVEAAFAEDVKKHALLPATRVADASKAENFKKSVEKDKARVELGQTCRNMRKERFEAYAEGRDLDEQLEGLRRFLDRERRGVLASCRRWRTDDFESVCVICKGSFGMVRLVKLVGSEPPEYYALKQMKKSSCRRKNQRNGAFAERDLLADARSRWIVSLRATFLDQDHLYMVMEFLQGGDLLTHLQNRKTFSLEETRFYMAELLEALDTVHRSGFVHRDVKPDNIVLMANGHLKLLDFGLCMHDTG